MKKWFKLSKAEAWVLAAILLGLLALVLAELSTLRIRKTDLCADCLARRRMVTRKVMWRTVEDRDVVYPLAGNEHIECQHRWIPRGRSSLSGMGGQAAWGSEPSTADRKKIALAIDEYENRTGLNYWDEVERIAHLDRKASSK